MVLFFLAVRILNFIKVGMIEQRDISEQLDMCQELIFQLYCICDKKCKVEIILFIKGNISNESNWISL